MDQNIRPRKFIASVVGHEHIEFDVTKEITAAGGVVPDVDENGTDVLMFSENAPSHLLKTGLTYRVKVREV